MFDTLSRYLSAFTNDASRRAVRIPLETLMDRYSSQPLTSAGLVIYSAGAGAPKIGAANFYACVKGVLVMVPAGTLLPSPTGLSIPQGSVGVACYFVDTAGNLTVAIGTPALTLAGVTWPQFPRGKALVGCLIITAASGAYTGGAVPLDSVTTVYVSPLGPFDPTALV